MENEMETRYTADLPTEGSKSAGPQGAGPQASKPTSTRRLKGDLMWLVKVADRKVRAVSNLMLLTKMDPNGVVLGLCRGLKGFIGLYNRKRFGWFGGLGRRGVGE